MPTDSSADKATPEELDALQSSSHAEIEALCKTVLDRWKLASEAYDKGYRNGVSASDADLRARVAELEAELHGFHSERPYVVGANAGWEAAVEQGEASPAAGTAMVRFWKRLAETHLARADAAEAELARLRQGAQDARIALVELANIPLGISLEDWGRLSSRILAALVSPGDAHPDDLAVDRFAAAMKAKPAKKRDEGRRGWEGPDCTAELLSRLLREHVEKGDPLDVGNLAMMLHQREERIVSPGDVMDTAERFLSEMPKRLKKTSAAYFAPPAPEGGA
jgi:hypothetical protein